mmetsp:Transcript_24473/g.52926  ORF Transcript_24473/g.52926 Transcript_24473/m.52926 type:complete len:102 (-) Transcript_24473:571-876(-)
MHGGTSYGHVSQDPHGGGGAAWQQRQAHKNKNNGADNNQFDVRHSNPSGDLSPREPEGGDDVLNTMNTAKITKTAWAAMPCDRMRRRNLRRRRERTNYERN